MNTTTTSTSAAAASATASPLFQTTGHHHQHHQALPIHIQVQQLNSNGAYYMNQGEYDMAIDSFIQALKLWETIDESEFDVDDSTDSAAIEAGCSIDDCILQQQQQQQSNSSNNEFPLHRQKQDASHQSIQTPISSGTTTTTCSQSSSSSSYVSNDSSSSSRMELDDEDESSSSHQQQPQERRFVYSRPILTTSQFWRTDRIVPKENTVSLILILNLAMAHHLSAIHQNQTQGQGQDQRSLLQKALQLYELAHQLQLDELTCSPMATMIIANNVGEIHLSVLNETKHHMCMNHLLSTMMYLIDNGQVPSSPSSSSSSGGDVVVNNNKNNYFWDGFLKNVSSILILKQNCAPVA